MPIKHSTTASGGESAGLLGQSAWNANHDLSSLVASDITNFNSAVVAAAPVTSVNGNTGAVITGLGEIPASGSWVGQVGTGSAATIANTIYWAPFIVGKNGLQIQTLACRRQAVAGASCNFALAIYDSLNGRPNNPIITTGSNVMGTAAQTWSIAVSGTLPAPICFAAMIMDAAGTMYGATSTTLAHFYAPASNPSGTTLWTGMTLAGQTVGAWPTAPAVTLSTAAFGVSAQAA